MHELVPLTASQRTQLYLYSNRNIAGSALGLAGLSLFFAGVIGTGWPLIVGGLYAAGVIGWPRNKFAEAAKQAQLSGVELAEWMARLVKAVAKGLPANALATLQSIQETLDELLPRLEGLRISGALSQQHAFTVQETLRRYLPDMLSSYLKLPPVFAKMQPLKDGRTAAQTLAEQLQLLDKSLKDISRDAFAGDAESLVISERFLREKFDSKPAFQLA